MNAEPRYRSIAADLAEKIRAGEYAPGAALPGQRDLSHSYGVTLMTLRQALRHLSDEGLIVQRAGKGTYVAPPHLAYRLGPLRNLADDLREQGLEVQTRVLDQALRRPPSPVAVLLGAPALRLERVRAFAGRPAVHQVSWVRKPFGNRIRSADFATASLYLTLADAGVAVARASETIRPAVLEEELAGHLHAAVGTPVFVSERITYSLDDTPIVADRAVILGDMMEIRAARAASGLSLTWSDVAAEVTPRRQP
ncbi:GntR family transcriptional regulator [Dactylosporangium sp. NPDC000521]|uniref:GntR family transcriptional regulator n=1 Tax=Dactylosporangium sp. NPDC000521 TaxID=3363975 RepID=UPI0036B381DC